MKLSLKGNRLRDLDLEQFHWPRLESLNVGQNSLRSVAGLGSMPALITLDLGQSLNFEFFTLFHWGVRKRFSPNPCLLLSFSAYPGIANQFLCPLLDSNDLRSFSSKDVMPKLRVLRISDNRLACFDAKAFPSLRTLYADNNRLGEFLHASRLTKLENLSLRHQHGTL